MTSPQEQRVAILDDDLAMLEALKTRFQIRGWEVATYSDINNFQTSELAQSRHTVFIVDHDLGGQIAGYVVVQKIRETRADGLAAPIVYLTGRESERGYLKKRLDQPALRPSCFINKNELAGLDLVYVCEKLLAHSRQVLQVERQQSIRREIDQIAASDYTDDEFDI